MDVLNRNNIQFVKEATYVQTEGPRFFKKKKINLAKIVQQGAGLEYIYI